MNTYECMYILQTNLSEDEAEKANARIVEEIEKRGGSVLHHERIGKRRLAYSIGRQDDGTYHLMHFQLPPSEVASLRAGYRLHPRLVRFLILCVEPDDVPKAQRRGPARAEKTGTAPGTEQAKPADADSGGEKDVEAPAEKAEAAQPDEPAATSDAGEPTGASAPAEQNE